MKQRFLPDDIQNIVDEVNKHKRSTLDICWHNRLTSKVLKAWGDKSLNPIFTWPKSGKGGKDTKGRGKGRKDAVTEQHVWNKDWWRTR